MNPYAFDALRVAGVFVLILINGYFVAAEYALVTVRWTRVEELVQQNRFGAHALARALDHLDGAIAASQLGVTFASLGLGWIGEPALAHLLEPLFRGLHGHLSVAVTHGV